MQHRQEEKLIEFIYFYRFKSVAGYTRETYVDRVPLKQNLIILPTYY